MFARYSLVGSLVAAVGVARGRAARRWLAGAPGMPRGRAAGHVRALCAARRARRRWSTAACRARCESDARRRPRRCANRSGIVYTLAALFSLDAFGGGFVVQSLVALWLYQRFGLSLAAAGTIFFWTGVLTRAVVSRRGAHRATASGW